MPRQSQNRQKLILGITGSFSSGKTTVARMFASGGAKLIDADKIAHSVLKPGCRAYKKIVASFGKGILAKNARINRKKLSGIVFNNKILLEKLNAIVHPRVVGIIKEQIKNSRSKVIVLDVPLLIEAGLVKLVDKIIVVKANTKKQIQRAKIKTSLGRVDIMKRIRSQVPLRVKLGLADFIIDNSGSIDKTRNQVAQIRRQLWKS